MPENETKPENEAPVAGLLAEFDGVEAVKAAAVGVRSHGYRRWDVHSPFPIHGIERAMGIRPTVLPWLVLGAGITGGVAALLLQWWTNAVNYPLNISGKPLFSLPANIPVTFELIVLFSALAAFGGALVLNLLPQYSHPVFSSERFRRMTSDGFFISIDATDPKFDEASTRAMLESLGATEVEVCRPSATRRRFPRATPWVVAATLVFALLPPLLIALHRAAPKRSPRIHLIADMDFQPKYLTQAESNFFADRRTMRPPVPGTVPEGGLEADDHFYRGKVGDDWATTLPIPATMAAIERGQQRYEIYCATCHGLLGNSRGMTALRAQQRQELKWVPPVSLVGAAVRDQPVGQIFNTITHGIRTMPSYAAQIPVEDRWKIVLYVRALQRSQRAGEGDVPEDVKLKLQ